MAVAQHAERRGTVEAGVNRDAAENDGRGSPAKSGGPVHFTILEETNSAKPWLITAILFAAAGVLLRNRTLIAAASLLGLSVGAAWAWSKVSFYGLAYEREFLDVDRLRGARNETRAFLGETVTLTLQVHNRKLIPLTWLRVVDIVPAHLPVVGTAIPVNRATNQGELTSSWMPGARQTLERTFEVRCTKRGYATYGPATLTTGDGFGLFERKARLDEEHRLIIYPRLFSAGELGLPAKNPFGERGSEQRLFEDPLRTAGIRDWQPGDAMKRVHWKASAKHQHLLSRVYEPSEEPQIQVILNVATLEHHWEGIVEARHELAVSVAGTLALLATEMRLPVGIMANGFLPGSDQDIRLLPGRSRGQLTNILELLAAVTPYASQPIEDFLLRKAPGLPWGATLAIVTPVTYGSLWEALGTLAKSGRKVLVYSLDDPPRPGERPQAKEQLDIKVYRIGPVADNVMVADELAGEQRP